MAISPPLLDSPANRVSTLTPASIRFLTDVGAWPEIAPPRSAPFSRMQVWDRAGSGFIQYDAARLSEATMGHVAENGLIQHALMEQLLPNVDRLWPVSALSCPCNSCKRSDSWQPCCMLQVFKESIALPLMTRLPPNIVKDNTLL